MEKIILTALFSALAGFITAVISIVKLVNEKERRTTDYRQAWTDSVRKALADLIGNIDAQASRMVASEGVKDELNRKYAYDLDDETSGSKRVLDHLDKILVEHRKVLYETKRAIYENYALARLHFKPNDTGFERVEKKFETLELLLTKLSRTPAHDDREIIRADIHAGANEIAAFARDLLKEEWEAVKRGEPFYQLTKKWSIRTSLAMLVILLSIGVYAGITIWKASVMPVGPMG
ncbi:hypothetical protein KTT56_19765 [Pseudomonas viridiflava]|uniref:hypothetical protein n=1 Tax=Pseudomonas TaxID=286 RepID=UPI000BA346A3|nr:MULTISPECIES: hypothetical protein [Pseudomonas]QXG24006.1 hypothetical protein KTT56_19765 [Pseudomonas viridiflava]